MTTSPLSGFFLQRADLSFSLSLFSLLIYCSELYCPSPEGAKLSLFLDVSLSLFSWTSLLLLNPILVLSAVNVFPQFYFISPKLRAEKAPRLCLTSFANNNFVFLFFVTVSFPFSLSFFLLELHPLQGNSPTRFCSKSYYREGALAPNDCLTASGLQPNTPTLISDYTG